MTEPIFYQNAYQAWSYSTVENNWDVYGLPIGTKFQTMNAPITAVSLRWMRSLFRVIMDTDKRTGETYRAYAREYHEQYDACPVADEFIVFSERVAIVGSREYPHLEHVAAYVNQLPMNAVIVSGGAKGVDLAAENAAKARRMKTVIFLPDWDTHGKAAGFIRNQDIVAACDRLVAFSHQASKGTANSIQLARQAGKQVAIYDSNGAIAA